MLSIPVAQEGPDTPSGHVVQVSLSSILHAEHIALQSTRGVILVAC